MFDIKNFIQKDKFAQSAGITLIEASQGTAKAEMTLDEKHMNGLGVAHGGAVFTLADLAFAAAANSYGTAAMAINISISYIKAVKSGTLTAIAEEESKNHKLSNYTVRVYDESHEPVALFKGLAYRKKDKI